MKNKKNIIATVVVFLSLMLCTSSVFSWGFWAHKEIHRSAISALPEGLKGFFEFHADSIIARAVEPDLRIAWDSAEAYYHYVDIDRYGTYPFNELPREYAAAVKKFGKAYVDTTGTATWRIADFTAKLSDAMKRDHAADIEYYASGLGHYVGDINVPLHSVINYNGQLTGQTGVHSRWERYIPERFGKNYTLGVSRIEYIADPLTTAFDILIESSTFVDKVLAMDKEAQKELSEDKLYTYIMRDTTRIRVFSDAYYDLYNKKLNGMVEERMNRSIYWVASYWYTAWVDAGKPKLTLK